MIYVYDFTSVVLNCKYNNANVNQINQNQCDHGIMYITRN